MDNECVSEFLIEITGQLHGQLWLLYLAVDRAIVKVWSQFMIDTLNVRGKIQADDIHC